MGSKDDPHSRLVLSNCFCAHPPWSPAPAVSAKDIAESKLDPYAVAEYLAQDWEELYRQIP
jgi:hypothetical protein